MLTDADEEVEVLISREQLALLKKHAFPCSERLLASADPLGSEFVLSGSHHEVERLAGFVAVEANARAGRGRRSRQSELWEDLSERLECAL